MKDVHTEHCCIFHGCKYYDHKNCTVVTKAERQSHACEQCQYERIDIRPWGHYQVLVDASDHKVKTITIRAGQRISLQRHKYRKETWTCVSGLLRAIVGRNVKDALGTFATPGFTIEIPQGDIHRAEAHGDKDCTFIEVQTGTYFGEDDIERFEDDYGRS